MLNCFLRGFIPVREQSVCMFSLIKTAIRSKISCLTVFDYLSSYDFCWIISHIAAAEWISEYVDLFYIKRYSMFVPCYSTRRSHSILCLFDSSFMICENKKTEWNFFWCQYNRMRRKKSITMENNAWNVQFVFVWFCLHAKRWAINVQKFIMKINKLWCATVFGFHFPIKWESFNDEISSNFSNLQKSAIWLYFIWFGNW